MKQLNRLWISYLAGWLLTCSMWGQATANTLEALLRGNADGTVSVLFRGVAGVSYRIEYTEAPPTEQTVWRAGIENLMANAGWTEWTDPSSGTAPQRLYRVVPQASVVPPASTPTGALGMTNASESSPHFLADSNIVQTAQTPADEAWARVKEAGDAGRLVGALGAGKMETALQVLREYGIAEATLTNMAARLGQPVKRMALKESFLRGVVGLGASDTEAMLKDRFQTAKAQQRERLYWVVKALGPDWTYRYDRELEQLAAPPIAVLDVRLQEVDLIRFFKWYDRYAEKLHSVLLNSENLSNWDLKDRYGDANLVVSGLYQLIKARNPEAFAWVRVVWQEDNSDLRWLQSLTFAPDGLVLWNLHSFMSPFDLARSKYVAVVGDQTPMLVAEFYGFWPKLSAVNDMQPIGKILDAHVDRFEQRMREWGYCGLLANWRLVEALGQARK